MLGDKQFDVVVDGKTITIATGGFAEQAGGAVTVRQGDTLLLATATMSRTTREGINFFPLTIDYEERMYAGGKIPGSFFRREGRPPETAILIDRLTDRPLRPLFPKDMRNDVQVIIYSLSSDGETPIDVLAILGASAALTISDVPFDGPVGSIRVGRNPEGEFIFNPSYQEAASNGLDLRMAGRRDAIMMVECNADELDEQTIVSALEAGHDEMMALIEVQEKMREELGKAKRDYPPFAPEPEVEQAIAEWGEEKIKELANATHDKAGFYSAMDAFVEEATEALEEQKSSDVRDVLWSKVKGAVRERVLSGGTRLDGRDPGDLRPLDVQVDLSPRAHGSGLFKRGETQVLTLATLGTPRERQELDILAPVEQKRYMHHYNFPPFSTGETKFLRGASRREIGHGVLAERALLPVMPSQDEFPYTMRLVSEVLSSNGSTSMASVCGSTIALLDTGVPIKAPVAGIAMGLISDGERNAILTDIQGVEDQLGDMDFKVAGTREGITALQMDIKIKGVTSQLMSDALAQALEARLTILDKIAEVIPEPRKEMKPHAPRMTVIKIDPQKIGAVIGPGGKVIRGIQDETGARIDIEDDGTIYIASTDGEGAKAALEMVERLIEEAVVGRIYTGKVVRTTDFGAFVEILPNKDGLVHISQLAPERIEKVEDVARVGEEITVMVTAIDPAGKIRLSRTAVLEGWTLDEAIERDRPPKRNSQRRGRPRRDNRSR
ncbi:MAG: polyribonucleotide nucleotidyltransferase [Chloroflexi bacterium]|nr:polyribonucleotide nucleotidyltransferase [Chloroflexota bacterium]